MLAVLQNVCEHEQDQPNEAHNASFLCSCSQTFERTASTNPDVRRPRSSARLSRSCATNPGVNSTKGMSSKGFRIFSIRP